MALIRRHGVKLSAYDFGRTTIHACQADPRFSWCAYVPEDYDEAGSEQYRLLVAVHGTMRKPCSPNFKSRITSGRNMLAT